MSQRAGRPHPARKRSEADTIRPKCGKHLSLVDPSLEYTDPTPDVHALFFQFNDRFFKGRLGAVVVEWSSRMTKNAGFCKFEGGDGLCTIRLSEPLLKLRPRRDLVETLLHEMIHAYLIVYKNDSNGYGHGPEFQKYARRINREAGTDIEEFHHFYEEVHFCRQHWYQCDGPCRQRRPCLATKRHKRCPPWPRDLNSQQHKQLCGGTFRKVRGPMGHTKGPNKGSGSGNIKSQ
ncbi:DNA-dependent metalloprotease dvc-1-like [Schistocerca cancellata]|uniref:DNA-dependent metalloprotease dvc-1-like n=1 Tax=Schistocerca cancellata TaxID=274614 RepID=UPI002118B2C1|nr:DNA-dependent metalloprotease dvc-1-like [Schistocerca cancellata]